MEGVCIWREGCIEGVVVWRVCVYGGRGFLKGLLSILIHPTFGVFESVVTEGG